LRRAFFGNQVNQNEKTVRMLNSYADYDETFNNQSKGGAGGAGNSGVIAGGGVNATTGAQLLLDSGELGAEDHTATDFAYAVHHGNGTGDY
jgi:hypothetical protein